MLVPAFSCAQTETERFDIDRFEVVGNTLLPVAAIVEVLMPFAGKRREYGDATGAFTVATRAAGSATSGFGRAATLVSGATESGATDMTSGFAPLAS